MKTTYKPKKITAGDLRTPVVFFEYQQTDEFEPTESKKEELFKCLALAYNPSMKDIELLKVSDTKEGLTIKIRDPKQSYQPMNNHMVEIHDYRYEGKVFNIVDVSYDMENNEFIKVILGNPS
ncbi:phage head-tail adapter protein [Vagococcus vulneris]|uniref:Phage head-tail adapter protein n=1 Tax=Vagococcus vulneris TaxID=1977869 RepID=A0A429ZTD5_9ENTE|nr:phage head-tail adapter protein [Vagococcus vulneris]RST96946.1 phage head-tail adapter protein [Vagococcus vulneris]